MVIAALVSFALLLVAWILAPTEASTTAPEVTAIGSEPEPIARAA